MTMQHTGPEIRLGAATAPFLYPGEVTVREVDAQLQIADEFAQIHPVGPVRLGGNTYHVAQDYDGQTRFLYRDIPSDDTTEDWIGNLVFQVPVEPRNVIFGYNGISLLTQPTPPIDVLGIAPENPYAPFTQASDEEHAQFIADLSETLAGSHGAFYMGKYFSSAYEDLIVGDSMTIHQFYEDDATGQIYMVDDRAQFAPFESGPPISHSLGLSIVDRGTKDERYEWSYSTARQGEVSVVSQVVAKRGGVQGYGQKFDHAGRHVWTVDLEPEELLAEIRKIEAVLESDTFVAMVETLRSKKEAAIEELGRAANGHQVEIVSWDDDEKKLVKTGTFRPASEEERDKRLTSLQEVASKIGFSSLTPRRLKL